MEVLVNELNECSACILVVDDEKNYRIVLKNLLEGANYRVLTADGSQGCLSILRNHTVDLVISDLHLTGVDGVGLCRQIYSELGPLPGILFSAYLSPRLLEKMAGTGIVACLSKPFDNHDLLLLIERVLSGEYSFEKPAMLTRQPLMKYIKADLIQGEVEPCIYDSGSV